MIGKTLGHYRVVEKLGAGGMGEVYRAFDEHLQRHVAIKALPDVFARDPERLARFEREARLLASLNHPNIAAIHGLEEFDGMRFLVLELVEGETLAKRLGKGGLPLQETLDICRQITEGLEAAHESAVVHRDLKPSNIMITAGGKVKILDFGLAKALATETPVADLTHSPTITGGMTCPGTILGTAAYMSPEQARGEAADKRCDIWAFGCILSECLTGRRVFARETVTETLAAILEGAPDWAALPETAPAKVRDLLRRCLQKDARRRLHDIADARIEIEEALVEHGRVPAATEAAHHAQWRQPAAWVLLALILGAVVIWRLKPLSEPAGRPLARFVVALPQNAPLATKGFYPMIPAIYPLLALSPDGTHLAYVAGRGRGTQLYLRPLDRVEATPIPGTEGGLNPFFSPDGQWLGFFSDGKLKKVALSGGSPMTICDAGDPRGASWGSDDTIIFGVLTAGGLRRVPAAGGEPQIIPITDLKKGQSFGQRIYRWPEILPDGKVVLFTCGTPGSFEEMSIGLKSLDTGEQKIVVEKGHFARFTPSGHLVYVHAGTLMAAPFDLRRLAVTGPAIPLLEGVMTGMIGAAQFSFSRAGTLAYIPGHVAQRQLVWVDRGGAAQPLPAPARPYGSPSLSPDGRRIAVGVVGESDDVWIYDVARDTLTRLSAEGYNHFPIWTPDGKRITFYSTRAGPANLFWQPADGSGAAERLLASENLQMPGSWSPDGKVLAFSEVSPAGYDIWMLPLEGDRKPRPFLRTSFLEVCPAFSPDGRWLAYVSNESGGNEVYVQPSSGGSKWQISSEGGGQPVWARNGRELFYRNGDKLMSAAIVMKPDFQAAKPVLLFEGPYDQGFGPWTPNYDVSPDARRFLMIKSAEQSELAQVHVVLEWFEDLKRRVAAGK